MNAHCHRSIRLSVPWLFLLILASGKVYGTDGFYPASLIPEYLSRDAGAVIRLSETNLDISSVNSVRITCHLVVTILHEDAMDEASVSIGYNDFKRIQRIGGAVYNAEGKEIQKIKASEFDDRSAIPTGTFHSSDRIKAYNPVYNGRYPVTFEYEYEVAGAIPACYPEWNPQRSYNVSVEKASLTVTSPPDLFPRYHLLNWVVQDKEQVDGKRKTIAWHIDNRQPFRWEPYAPPVADRIPGIILAPVKIDYKGFSGDFTAWSDLGNWTRYLLNGRDKLPERTVQTIRQMTDRAPDTLLKIRTLYHFLQTSKRYVSIQLGIGGWQPLEAASVDEQGYGDCKALVNYMHALLKAAGIDSYYSLVYAGWKVRDVLPDFPSMNFNHVILCVPVAKDTVWLECTNPTIPFGFLGGFTENRHVLVITPTETMMTKTPVYTAEMNLLQRKAVVTIASSGDAEIDMTTRYTGLQFESVDDLSRQTIEEQKKALISRLGIPNTTIKSVNYHDDNTGIPAMEEHIVMMARSYASSSGERIFVPVDPMNRMDPVTINSQERQAAIQTGYPYIDLDSLVVKWPSGYHLEALPPETELNTPYGHYKATILSDSTRWIYIRRFEREKTGFPVEDYPEFRDFINSVAKADRQKAILKATRPKGS